MLSFTLLTSAAIAYVSKTRGWTRHPFEMTPQNMIEALLDPEAEGVGKLIWDAYSHFYKDFPIENLRPLLISSSDEVVSRGAFLANELGWRARALTPEIAVLIDCANVGIRFNAIGALTSCTTSQDGDVLGKLFQHLEDPFKGVRWRMVQFVRLARSKQLAAAIRNAASQRPDSMYAEISETLRWSMRVTEVELQRMVGHSEAGVRLFAAGMALRPRSIIDERFAEIVLETGDSEPCEFVSSAFQMHAIPISAEFGRVENSGLAERSRGAKRQGPSQSAQG
ncbi:hypothetical protein [Mesorhizobium sp. CN2-181]|uniref:hypothetical protein n=1 Tax=Mesorhizobium yinganensis TaxID=3157707 RepID=UPI0032B765FB